MRRTVFIFLSVLLTSGIFAQKVDKLPKNPDEKITINKEYDENGNLIGYDSTYVHTWSSDTSMVFPFQGGDLFSFKGGFPNLDKFMQQFFSDPFSGEPYSGMDDNMMKPFRKHFSDSLLIRHSPFAGDSIQGDPFSGFWFKNDPFGGMDKNFGKEIEKMRKQMEKSNQWFAFPDSVPGNHFYYFNEPFQNEEQMKEYKALQEKQRKEMEKFRKKWESKNKKELKKI